MGSCWLVRRGSCRVAHGRQGPIPSRRNRPRPADPGQALERTCFQTQARRWDAMIQLRSDVAMCYGVDESLPRRIAEWKEQGYITHMMTGVSWGQYQDYLYGRFDGVKHVDEAQTDRRRRVDLSWRRRLLHVAGRELWQVPLPGRQAGDGRRRRGDPSRGARVLGPRRLQRGVSARMEGVLPRRLDSAPFLARCAVSCFVSQILPLPPGPAAGLRVRQGRERADGPARQVLCPDAQPASITPTGGSSVPSRA